VLRFSLTGSSDWSCRRGLDRDLGVSDSLGREPVGQFYGDGRKVVCGLGIRGGRLACSLDPRSKQATPTEAANVTTTGI
jgi:hypothetical protein